jgi:hypothetical protein
MVAGPGIAPGTRAYETLEILLLHPAIEVGSYPPLLNLLDYSLVTTRPY